MNLLNVIAASRRRYDTDALTWYNAVVAAGGPGEWGSTAGARLNNKNALNTMVKALKAASLWTGFKMRVLAGTNSIAGGLASGVGGTITNNNFVSGDINALTGWLGNGTTKNLATNWAGNANGQNDFCAWVWVTQASSGSVIKIYLANGLTTAGIIHLGTDTTQTPFTRAKSTTSTTSPTAGPITGLFGVNRSVSGSYTARINGANEAVAVASDGNAVGLIDIFSRAAASYSDGRISAFGTGPSGNMASLQTILATYHASIQA